MRVHLSLPYIYFGVTTILYDLNIDLVEIIGNTAVVRPPLDVSKSRHKWPVVIRNSQNEFYILYGNASTEEAALRFLQDNNVIKSVPSF